MYSTSLFTVFVDEEEPEGDIHAGHGAESGEQGARIKISVVQRSKCDGGCSAQVEFYFQGPAKAAR